jgi:hypothetical protein
MIDALIGALQRVNKCEMALSLLYKCRDNLHWEQPDNEAYKNAVLSQIKKAIELIEEKDEPLEAVYGTSYSKGDKCND